MARDDGMVKPARVLIVDDDEAIRASLSAAVREDGLEVSVASDAAAALGQLAAFAPDIVLTDVRMPGMDGVSLLQVLRERVPSVDVVLMTAHQDMPTVVSAMQNGAVEFLVKPLHLDHLLEVLHRTIDDRKLRRHAPKDVSSDTPIDLVGRHPLMVEIYKMVAQAAARRASVLIRGESGTGKELIARAIHQHSPDAAQPFIPVNCAALPSGLLESELFGHVRGAFTGAAGPRRGRFALAGHGTIFLDEIGDTTLEFQSKLLRVLQDREFFAVGAEQPERTEARVIAATHRNLEELIATERFRHDVYYRLRVVEITLPPLRERQDDIPLLAAHFVQRASRVLGCQEPVLSPKAIAALSCYDWPGNIRELENCLTRAVVLAAGHVIREEHVEAAVATSTSNKEDSPLGALHDIEREHVRRVLNANDHNKSRAAEVLRISLPRLTRLMRKYVLD